MSEKTKYFCKNCRLEFEVKNEEEEKPDQCPRCSSKHVFRKPEKTKKHAPETEEHVTPRGRMVFSTQKVYGDTKEAWKSFHSSEQKQCPHCGGTDFELDFKHKQKVCRKCGEVLPLRRRPA